mmetsp:Transcript_29885/g.42011  ORF Transcript_29885/g.42011 Transcript_29885/m.42011 type:complete len:483 (+) Transcript_29885:36-1484(+)
MNLRENAKRWLDAITEVISRFKVPLSVATLPALIPNSTTVIAGAAVSTVVTLSIYIASERVRRITYLWKVFWPGFIEYKINEFKVNRKYYKTEDDENASWEKLHQKYAPRLLKAILTLEGVFYKVGQVYGSRKDFVPDTYFKHLNQLVDKVPPKPFKIMRPKMESDFGASLEEVFEEFIDEALAAASIGQVYRAKLKDGEIKDVVVKTTYPNSEKLTRADMKSFLVMARLTSPEQVAFLEEFSRQLMHEFDFRREARMQTLISESLKEEFPDIVIPKVVDRLVKKGSMVMEFIDGYPLMTSLFTLEPSQQHQLIQRMIQVLGKMALVDGRFHSDPHPGNWLITKKEGKICMLDFGQTKEISQKTRKEMAELTLLLKSNPSEQQLAAMMRKIGFRSQKDRDITYAYLGQFAFDSNFLPNIMQSWIDIMQADPILDWPGEFAMLSRLGIMLRGMVSLFPNSHELRISALWEPYALRALNEPILS